MPSLSTLLYLLLGLFCVLCAAVCYACCAISAIADELHHPLPPSQ